MTGAGSGIEGRMAVAEGKIAQLEHDEDDTRMLAAKADHTVSEFGGALKGNTNLIETLRETQVEHGKLLATHRKQLKTQGRQLDAQGRRLEAVDRQLDEQGRRLKKQGRRLDEHSELLRGLDDHVQGLDDRVQGLDDRVQGLDGRVDSLEAEMRRGFATLQDGMTRVVALLERRPEE